MEEEENEEGELEDEVIMLVRNTKILTLILVVRS